MNIYRMSQDLHNSYDTYDSVIVAAESVDDARTIHPSQFITHMKNGMWMCTYAEKAGGGEYEMDDDGTWVSYSQIDKIQVELIGIAADGVERGVLLASFNAG